MAVELAVLRALAAGAGKALRPTRWLQCLLALRLLAIALQECRQR